jgi:thymidylate synthase
MEWFMSGDSKCPEKLSKWWAGQLNEFGCYMNGYSHQLRQSIYSESIGKHSFFDQIKYILEGIKEHPHSRRLRLTTWNTGDMANITKSNNNTKTPSTCFPSWSTVLTNDGIRTISDLSVGEFIWDGSKYVEVLAITPKGIQDVYCASTRKGNFYSTLDHKVSNGRKLVPLKDAKRLEICTGEKIAVVNLDHDLFFSRIGFIQKYKAQKPAACSKNTTTALVKDLSLHSTEEVFDITVNSPEHLLWCNGFKVSNCHGSFVQFFVVDGALHIKHFQASIDTLLGLPHNFVQYWALLTYFAFHANIKVGSLTWVFGDAHIYNEESHMKAAKEIISFGKSHNNLKLNLVYNYSGELDSFGTPKFAAADFTIEGEIPKPTVLTKPKLL